MHFTFLSILIVSQLFSCNSAADKRDTLANGKSGSLTGSSKRTFSFGFNGDAGMGLADASSSAPSPELKSVRINTKCLKSPVI